VSLSELEPRCSASTARTARVRNATDWARRANSIPTWSFPDAALSLEIRRDRGLAGKTQGMNIYYSRVLRQFARDFGIGYSTPYKDIPKKVQDILMFGRPGKATRHRHRVRRRHPATARRSRTPESEWVKHRLHSFKATSSAKSAMVKDCEKKPSRCGCM